MVTPRIAAMILNNKEKHFVQVHITLSMHLILCFQVHFIYLVKIKIFFLPGLLACFSGKHTGQSFLVQFLQCVIICREDAQWATETEHF
jgi:hypothetical protein